MKVLQLSVHFSPNIGGVETHLDDLVKELSKREYEVSVLAYRPLVAKSKWNLFEKKQNIKIYRIPWLPGFFYKFIHNPIFEFLYLAPGLFFVLPIFLILNRPNVIQSHGLVAGFASVFWGKLFKIRVIATTHSLYHFPETGLYKKFAKWVFMNSSHTLCLSELSKSEILSLGVPKNRASKFTYWIDLEKFKPSENISSLRRKLGWGKKFVVLFVGRLIPEKGIHELITASKSVGKNTLFVVAGEGPLKERLQSEALKNKSLSYIGRIEQSKIPDYYSAADVVIVPSIHDEGFGRVIIEALACGTPVIAANRGSIPEAMDKSVGLLIDVTPENIANAVNRIRKDNLLNSLTKNTRKFAEKLYSERNVEDIVGVYAK